MQTARNLTELNQMLMKEMRKAMKVVSEKSLADMYDETEGFYAGTTPKVYERTGKLGDTPRTTGLKEDPTDVGGEVTFEAYLDTNYTYTTGKEPTMEDVLKIANNHKYTHSSVGRLRPPIGKQGFWDRSLKKIQENLNEVMGNYFKG